MRLTFSLLSSERERERENRTMQTKCCIVYELCSLGLSGCFHYYCVDCCFYRLIVELSSDITKNFAMSLNFF